MPVAELPGVAMWYESGTGPVLLHAGGAGVDSRALDPMFLTKDPVPTYAPIRRAVRS